MILLNRGGFSVVHKAVGLHTVEKKIVAMKEIDILKLTKKQSAALLSEMNILSQLKHQSIVRLHAVYFQNDRVYMVMDYLRGGELLNAICLREKYTEGDARRLLRQITSALCYMHSRKIIHHDIKPENLIFETRSFESNIKIIDFGFAIHEVTYADYINKKQKEYSKMLGSESAVLLADQNTDEQFGNFFGNFSRTLRGTPGYMAPELIKYKHYNSKIDIWSLGVVMFILLSGTMPYPTDSPTRVLEMDHHFPEHRWKKVSTKAKMLINRMLCKDPASRPTGKLFFLV